MKKILVFVIGFFCNIQARASINDQIEVIDIKNIEKVISILESTYLADTTMRDVNVFGLWENVKILLMTVKDVSSCCYDFLHFCNVADHYEKYCYKDKLKITCTLCLDRNLTCVSLITNIVVKLFIESVNTLDPDNAIIIRKKMHTQLKTMTSTIEEGNIESIANLMMQYAQDNNITCTSCAHIAWL